MVDPLSCRKRKSVTEIIDNEYAVSTGKPYTLAEFKVLLQEKEKWEKIPSNRKLYTLYTALCQGPEKTRETLKYIFLRHDETRSQFQPLWDTLSDIDGDYPLWRKTVHESEDVIIHQTGITDQLELRWLMLGPMAEGDDA